MSASDSSPSLASQIRQILTPRGSRVRKLRFGLVKGTVANIDLSRDSAFFLGLHEQPLHSHYRRLVKRGAKSFDVGMYRGWDALALAYLSGAEVVSFDGNPDTIRDAEALIAPSGLGDQITLVNSYISDGAGMLSLDAACETYFTPDFVKMDIEGAEAAALRGAARLLSERKPALIIETHGLEVENECVAILRSHRYTVTIVEQPRGFLREWRPIEHNRWLVCEAPTA